MDMLLTAFKEFFKQNLQNLMPSWNSWKLKSLNLDIKDGHALNSLLRIFQTTSSNPYILLSRNLMEGIMQHGDSEKVKSFHLEIKDDQDFNSHIVVLKTTSLTTHILFWAKTRWDASGNMETQKS